MAMRQYVKTYPTFWIGTTGKALRESGQTAQLVALYLISNPHVNYIGLYRLHLAYASTDLNMSEKALVKALATLEGLGFAKFDLVTEMVWVLRGAYWQIGESLLEKDRRVKFVQGEYTAVPAACPMKAEFFAKYAEAYGLSDQPANVTRPQVKSKKYSFEEPAWEPEDMNSRARSREI
jgi:hypothetical protein